MQNRRTGKRRTGGYIIEQLLISLAICAFLIPVASALLAVLIRAFQSPLYSQDEAALAQLRHVIAVSDDFECTASEIRMLHHGDTQRLHLANRNLVLTSPGTQIFVTDLESVSFSQEGDLLYLTYAHPEKKPVQRCLGHV